LAEGVTRLFVADETADYAIVNSALRGILFAETDAVVSYLPTHIRREVRLLLAQLVLRHSPIPNAGLLLKSLHIDILGFDEVYSRNIGV
jgi:hypothetical protein